MAALLSDVKLYLFAIELMSPCVYRVILPEFVYVILHYTKVIYT